MPGYLREWKYGHYLFLKAYSLRNRALMYVPLDSHLVADFVRTDHNELSESIYEMHLIFQAIGLN